MHRVLTAPGLLVVVVLLGFFVAACGDDRAVTTEGPGAGDTRPSIAGDWILVSLTVDGEMVPLPSGAIGMTIELGEIDGNLGCNSFFGQIDAAEDGTLIVGSLGQTEMACAEEGRMAFESTYGRALSAATAWSIDPAGLTLSGASVQVTYSQAPPSVHRPLERTVWNFDTTYEGPGPDRAASNRAEMQDVTLVIENSEATIVGPGCAGTAIAVEFGRGNEGEFRTGAGGDLPDAVACGIVGEALDGLTAASGFMIDENRLTFVGEAGETVGFSASAAE